jgi:hypothetical protein
LDCHQSTDQERANANQREIHLAERLFDGLSEVTDTNDLQPLTRRRMFRRGDKAASKPNPLGFMKPPSEVQDRPHFPGQPHLADRHIALLAWVLFEA